MLSRLFFYSFLIVVFAVFSFEKTHAVSYRAKLKQVQKIINQHDIFKEENIIKKKLSKISFTDSEKTLLGNERNTKYIFATLSVLIPYINFTGVWNFLAGDTKGGWQMLFYSVLFTGMAIGGLTMIFVGGNYNNVPYSILGAILGYTGIFALPTLYIYNTIRLFRYANLFDNHLYYSTANQQDDFRETLVMSGISSEYESYPKYKTKVFSFNF